MKNTYIVTNMYLYCAILHNIRCDFCNLDSPEASRGIDGYQEDFRLVGGTGSSGRVQVKLNGVWSSVCSREWNDQETLVVSSKSSV